MKALYYGGETMGITFLKQKRFYVFLGLALIIVLRFFLSWFATFGIDSPLIYNKTAELFNTGVIPPFSIYIPIAKHAFIPGPGIPLIYGVMYFITKNPIYVGMMTGILQLLGILVLYFMYSQLFSKRTGLIIAFLMLLSPWLSYYSVEIWNPNLIFLFASLAFFALFKLKENNKPVYWCILVFGISMASQVHMSAFLLIAVSFLFLLYYRVWPRLISILLGLLVFAVLFFPYIKYEIATGGYNTRSIFSGTGDVVFKFERLLRAIHFSVIFTSTEIAHFAGAGLKRAIAFYSYHPILSVVFIPLSLLTAYLAYVMFYTFIKAGVLLKQLRTSPVAFIFFTAFIINPMVYCFTSRPFSPHNLIVIAPILWIPIAWFIEHSGRLFFPYINLKQVGYIYVIASLIGIYMIMVDHPHQVPVRDVVKIAEFVGNEQNAPVYLEGVSEVTQLDALESLHKNYYGRQYPLIASSEKDAKGRFILLDKRTHPIAGVVVLETPTVVVIQK